MILMEMMQDLMAVRNLVQKNGNFLRNSWRVCGYKSFRLNLNRGNVRETTCFSRMTITTFLSVCFGEEEVATYKFKNCRSCKDH